MRLALKVVLQNDGNFVDCNPTIGSAARTFSPSFWSDIMRLLSVINAEYPSVHVTQLGYPARASCSVLESPPKHDISSFTL